MRYCVFSGSYPGVRAGYRKSARELGELIAAEGIGLVYGGASVGLMAAVADAALEAGGEVIGVMPRSLVEREISHKGLTDLRITASMHERKALMSDLSDGFIALPGGIGTLEETFEMWTWAKLGHHCKPCALLNSEGFYDGLNAFLNTVVAEGFLRAEYRKTLICESDAKSVLRAMKNHAPSAPIEK